MKNQCSVTKSLIVFLGRIALSLIFVIAGVAKIMDFGSYATMMSGVGVPHSQLMLVIAILFELGGGLLVLLGWYARFGALLLLLFIIPVTYYFHSFWGFQGADMVNQMHHFLKNLSIFGGMLYVLACGPGHISIDGFVRKRCCHNRNKQQGST